MARYFDRFPVIDYNGVIAKNILARVDFSDQSKKDIYSTFEFTLQEGFERPDLLSYNYYDSSLFDWMIYLTNGIVDPYYDYYKSTEDFKSFINTKYGSERNARSITLFYRTNWHNDERLITAAEYEALQCDEIANLRKYWKPKLANTGAIIGYERSKEDWVVSTNKIVLLSLTQSPSDFNVGDIVSQTSTEALGVIDFIDTDNNTLTVKHVRGTFEANQEEAISNVTLLAQSISDLEAEYWVPVNAFEDEKETNELKRNVIVLKRAYLADVEKQFINQLRT